jgi:hypothetical protein
MTKDEAQRRRWTFCEAVTLDYDQQMEYVGTAPGSPGANPDFVTGDET